MSIANDNLSQALHVNGANTEAVFSGGVKPCPVHWV